MGLGFVTRLTLAQLAAAHHKKGRTGKLARKAT